MRGHGLRRTSSLVIAAALAAATLAACHDGGSGTRATANGRPAAAPPTDSASTTQAGAAPCTFSGAAAAAQGGANAPTRLLSDVRVGVHDCYERVTFEFKPQRGEAVGPVAWKAAYEPGPITQDGSGKTVPVKGNAYLVLRFTASGVDLSQANAPETYSGPASLEAAGATRIQQVRRTGDFEAVLTWVIGLDKKRPFKVSTQDSPIRVVVDVGD
jgi:hypothetical protein